MNPAHGVMISIIRHNILLNSHCMIPFELLGFLVGYINLYILLCEWDWMCLYAYVLWIGMLKCFSLTAILQSVMEGVLGQDPEQSNTRCHPNNGHCFTLYTFPEAAVNKTWSYAYSYCQSLGQRLAVIPDNNTQVVMETLQQTTSYRRLAWVAGKLSDDDTWRNMDGSKYTGVFNRHKQNIYGFTNNQKWILIV